MNNIPVSIIIPTYNDWARLSLCIGALARQTFSAEMFEVIIVNNNVQDEAPPDFVIPFNTTLLVEAQPGSYAARNAALRIARGKIIGFTDSDCIPDENWIANAVSYLKGNSDCSRVAGRVSVFCRSEKSKIEMYDKIYAFNQKSYVKSGTSVTANLFTYKHVFENVGYFNDKLMSGGDFVWGTLANEKGYKVDYVDNVIVKHPARDNLKELLKKERRVGGSQAKFLRDGNNPVRNYLHFFKELRPRLSEAKFIYSRGKNLTTADKIYIYLMRHYLLGVRAYAKLSVQMGKKPNRA